MTSNENPGGDGGTAAPGGDDDYAGGCELVAAADTADVVGDSGDAADARHVAAAGGVAPVASELVADDATDAADVVGSVADVAAVAAAGGELVADAGVSPADVVVPAGTPVIISASGLARLMEAVNVTIGAINDFRAIAPSLAASSQPPAGGEWRMASGELVDDDGASWWNCLVNYDWQPVANSDVADNQRAYHYRDGARLVVEFENPAAAAVESWRGITRVMYGSEAGNADDDWTFNGDTTIIPNFLKRVGNGNGDFEFSYGLPPQPRRRRR